MTTPSDQPLLYKAEEESGETVEIYLTINGQEHKRKVRSYSGRNANLEPWCKMHLSFEGICSNWNIENNGPRKFEVYSQLLDENALSTWNLILDQEPARNNDAFNDAINIFVLEMSSGNPRNKAAQYFETHEVRKRRGNDVQEHYRRLKQLFTYHDMLPGNSPFLNDQTPEALRLRKKILCSSFPDAWGKAFNTMTMRELEDPTVDEKTLINFMQQWKNKTDSLDAQRQRIRQGSGRGGRMSYQGRGRYQGPPRSQGRGRGYYGRGYHNYRPRYQSQPYSSISQGYSNYQGNNPFQRYPPSYNNFRGRGNYRGGGNNFRGYSPRQAGNRNQGNGGNRAPMGNTGRGYQQPQQHHYAESHYNQEAEGFVPEGNVQELDQGGMPFAEMQSAEQDQQDNYFVQGTEHDYAVPTPEIDQHDFNDQEQHFDESYFNNGDY